MMMENYLLPHVGLTIAFRRPPPLLATILAKFLSPLSLHADTSSMHLSQFEDYVCFASVPPWPLLWLATEDAITPFPLSLSVEFHT